MIQLLKNVIFFLIFIGFVPNITQSKINIEIIPIIKNDFNKSYVQEGNGYYIQIKNIEEEQDNYANISSNLCLINGYYFYNDTRMNNYTKQQLKYKKKTRTFVSDTFTIPINSTLLYLQIYENNTKITDFLYYPIFNQKRFLNKGASEYLLNVSDSIGFLEYFNYEVKTYPDNINIYPLKWSNEIKYNSNNKTGVKESIYRDLAKIEINNNDSVNKLVVDYIGNYLVENNNKCQEIIDVLCKYKDIDVLNNYFVSDFFYFLLTKDKSVSDLSSDTNFYKLIINNPKSHFTENIIKSGKFQDIYNHSSPHINSIIEFFKQKVNSGNISFNDKLVYSYYLLFSNNEENIINAHRILKPLLEELVEKSYCDRKEDPLNHVYLKRSTLFNLATISMLKNNLNSEGLKLQNYILSKYSSADIEYKDAIYYKARFFQKMAIPDSMIYYYLLSYKLTPSSKQYKKIKKELSVYFNIGDENDRYKYWFDSLVSNVTFKSNFQNIYGGPVVKLESDSLNILDLDNVVVEFYSNNCTFCNYNLSSLNTYSDEFYSNNKIAIIIVPLEATINFSKYKFPMFIAKNNLELIKHFDITVYPTTIVLSKGIIKHRIEGSNKNGINLYDLFE